ncbi:hypothetical protein [Paenibacillus koleovorans]|uniref:hypothetical protein n=1 Tax=Paenibacillus koleovorans TaxID=121608 RepID=UPI000FD89CD2|nr:hypothetical protein [Paenibacillus koleovorans]
MDMEDRIIMAALFFLVLGTPSLISIFNPVLSFRMSGRSSWKKKPTEDVKKRNRISGYVGLAITIASMIYISLDLTLSLPILL